jgi:Ca2+-binding RTX toxin-like protein
MRWVLVMAAICLGAASAQASTCSFDAASGVVTVTLQQTRSTLSATSTGAIEFDGAPCGTASTTSTARIVVDGDPAWDYLTLRGRFAPGRNDVADPGLPEIEIQVGFNGSDDLLQVYGASGDDHWIFTAAGIDLNGDGDEDLSGQAAGTVRLWSLKGNDIIDASAYTVAAVWLQMRGGAGNDTITGSPRADNIRGNDGDDVLRGGAGNDNIDDGLGDDRVYGGGGDDALWALDEIANGADIFHGNAGRDRIAYHLRTVGVTVTLDGVADDGEPGERDNVHPDVEDVIGGYGDDVLVGSAAANRLDSGGGYNELYGGDGDDELWGQGLIVGDAGNDILRGSSAADSFDGGDGDDIFYNLDGVGDTVDCGAGVDDAEPDPLDSFIGCEDI